MQLIHKSNPLVGPSKSESMPKFSEYRTQFKPWMQSMPVAISNNNNKDGDVTPTKKAKVRVVLSQFCFKLQLQDKPCPLGHSQLIFRFTDHVTWVTANRLLD